MISLISQLLMQSSMSLFQLYLVCFQNVGIELCLVVQARKWKKNLERICMKSSIRLWIQYKRSYNLCIGNWWAQWTSTICVLGCILCARVVQDLNDCFPDVPLFSATTFLVLIITQAMTMTKSQLSICGSKWYYWSFNILKKKSDMYKDNLCNLWKHFDISVRTTQYLRLGAYVVLPASQNDNPRSWNFFVPK